MLQPVPSTKSALNNSLPRKDLVMAVADNKFAHANTADAEARAMADARLVDSWYADFERAKAASRNDDRATQICRELADRICQLLASQSALIAEEVNPPQLLH
jgi:hypothetical protein